MAFSYRVEKVFLRANFLVNILVLYAILYDKHKGFLTQKIQITVFQY